MVKTVLSHLSREVNILFEGCSRRYCLLTGKERNPQDEDLWNKVNYHERIIGKEKTGISVFLVTIDIVEGRVPQSTWEVIDSVMFREGKRFTGIVRP